MTDPANPSHCEVAELRDAAWACIKLFDNIEKYGAMANEADWLKVKAVRDQVRAALGVQS